MASANSVSVLSPCVRELGARGTLRVSGPDRVIWLNGLLSCDVSKVTPDQAAWGLLLNRVGKIQSDVCVVDAGESLLLSVSPGTTAHVAAELEQRLIMEDAALQDESATWTWSFWLGDSASELAQAHAAACGGVRAALDWLRGPGGTLVAAPRNVPLPEALVRLGDEPWVLLRVRAGLGEFGVDFTAEDRPHEASLDRRAVAWNKGCYLGQEVVCMQDMRGKVKHALRTFSAAAPAEAQFVRSALHTSSDKVAGEVRSCAFDVTTQRWWLLANVTLELLSEPLAVAWGGTHFPLEVAAA